jgi:hypothetical protein
LLHFATYISGQSCFRDGGHEQLISNGGRFKQAFAERDKCKPILLGLSLAGNLVKPLLSLYGTEWRERGYGLRRGETFPTNVHSWASALCKIAASSSSSSAKGRESDGMQVFIPLVNHVRYSVYERTGPLVLILLSTSIKKI